jgi:hypothetical protein
MNKKINHLIINLFLQINSLKEKVDLELMMGNSIFCYENNSK